MNIFFQDPNDIPLPPEQVRIRSFRVEPRPDGRRVRIFLELTPFLKQPDGEIIVKDSQGVEVASLNFIETIVPKMEFTLHLRLAKPEGRFTASATIFYRGEPEEGKAEPKVVDRAETFFQIP
jgi:hypothetical protein